MLAGWSLRQRFPFLSPEPVAARPTASIVIQDDAARYRAQLLLGHCHCVGLFGGHRLRSLQRSTAAHPQLMMAV